MIGKEGHGMKRGIVLVLAFAVMLSMMPMTAFAAGGKTPGKAKIKSVKFVKAKKTVVIKWKKTKGAAKYQVFEKRQFDPNTGKKGKWKKVKTVKKTTVKLKRKDPMKYSYKIRAIGKSKKQGKFSKVKSVTYKMSFRKVTAKGYAWAYEDYEGFYAVKNNTTMITDYKPKQTENQTYNSTTSDPKMKFQSLCYAYDVVNPQSLAIDPEGNTAWIMGNYNVGTDNKKRGRIWKISLKKYWGKDAKGDKNPSIKEGPMIVTGHGQTLCYNRVTKTLWYLRETKTKKSTLVEVNPKTLEIIREIKFKFAANTILPTVMTIDYQGNFWMYTKCAGGTYVPEGALRFYQGRLIEEDKVQFDLVMTGLRTPPGPNCQAISYDPYENRIYCCSNGQIVSVPAAKMLYPQTARVTPSEVKTIKFTRSPSREFEDIAFTQDGCAFFLSNRHVEIMRDAVTYKRAMKQRQ